LNNIHVIPAAAMFCTLTKIYCNRRVPFSISTVTVVTTQNPTLSHSTVTVISKVLWLLASYYRSYETEKYEDT